MRSNFFKQAPNTLVRVDGDADSADDVVLEWGLGEGCAELVLLTPEYKGPPLLPVAGAFFVLCAALIGASTTGS